MSIISIDQKREVITEEAIEFRLSYMSSCKPIGVLKSRHEGKCEGKGVC